MPKLKLKAAPPIAPTTLTLTATINIEELAESISTQFDTPEKFVELLKVLEGQYHNYDFLLATAQWAVGEVKKTHDADKEPFDFKEVFADALKA